MSDIDRPAHDPLEQNLDENQADAEVIETIVDDIEVTAAEESAVNTDNETAQAANAMGEETEAVETAEEEPKKKKKNRESTSEKAKKAAAAREAAGLSAQASKVKLDPLRLRGKKYRAAVKEVDRTKAYSVEEAVELAKKTSIAKFDAAVEIHAKVKTEGVRGVVTLPHGTGKTKKVAIVNDELLEQIAAGKLDFDVLLATPAYMPKLARFAKVLGPKGLMPSPKAGTVTEDPEKIQAEISGGRTEYRADKNGVVHMAIGRVSFPTEKLVENFNAIYAVLQSNKVQSLSMSATMGPGIRVSAE